MKNNLHIVVSKRFDAVKILYSLANFDHNTYVGIKNN